MSYVSWGQRLPIPWLVARAIGKAYTGAYMEQLDAQADHYRQATTSRFPTFAPVDALAPISDERQIERFPGVPDATFRGSLRNAWGAWIVAGSPFGLLARIVEAFPTAVIVQQNGRGFYVSGGALVAVTLGTNPTISETPPWWLFDFDDAHTSRFAVLVFTDPTSVIDQLRRTITRWKPAKATCVGIFYPSVGTTIGWPVRIIGNGSNIGPATVVAFTP